MRWYQDKIVDRLEFCTRSRNARQEGRAVVFSNGCFDILHAGHVDYLARARGLGDVLFLGVNADSSVRLLKGPSRPIVPEEQRAAVLAALEMVDCVTLFQEPTPLELIEASRPQVLVKGGDYTREAIVGAAEVESWGGQVRVLPLVPGLGTTEILNKILAGDGGQT